MSLFARFRHSIRSSLISPHRIIIVSQHNFSVRGLKLAESFDVFIYYAVKDHLGFTLV